VVAGHAGTADRADAVLVESRQREDFARSQMLAGPVLWRVAVAVAGAVRIRQQVFGGQAGSS
jgi:hypothetical protein